MTSSILRKSAFAFTLALGAAALSNAQPAPTPIPAQPGAVPGSTATPAALPRPIRASQLLNTRINLQNNTAAGTVADIVFSDGGDVEYLVVKRDDGNLVSVPWSAAIYNADQKSIVVNITPEQYKVVPTYTATTYPDYFAPTYRTETYKYYNVAPGQFRRIERRLNRP
jgi:hypothetical protein